MPASCCKPDYDAAFDARTARRQATKYRRRGARGSTRRLIEGIKRSGIRESSVLDVGGGVGIVGLELLAAGAASVTEVDASGPYIAVARHEAARAGWADRTLHIHGDFVELAAEIEAADVVALDRVVCCYGDWRAMIDRSTEHAARSIGLVFPNDRWWLRAGIGLGNLCLRLVGQSFRGYVHPERAVDERVRAAGFERRLHHRGWVWQTALYERVSPAAPVSA
ncbi:MAG TPA: methyltransferase domain-containing protein [Candidatus Limnocylindria bacterium]